MSRIELIPPYSMVEYEAEISALLEKANVFGVAPPPSSGHAPPLFCGSSAGSILTTKMDPADEPRDDGGALLRMTNRLDFFSKAFLNRLYGANGEGEQGEFDQRPLFRTDYFDCVTYVNTVLALAISNTLQDFRKNMVKINYRGTKPLYENRHHFLSVDWNVENEKLGLIEDITEAFGIPLDMAETIIDREGFFRHKQFKDIKLLHPISSSEEEKLLEKLHACHSELMTQHRRHPSACSRDDGSAGMRVKSRVSYLSLNSLLNNQEYQKAFFDKLPLVLLAEMVRPNWDLTEKIGTHLNFSHLGFLFKQGEQLRFRHATITQGKVVEVDFLAYLKEFEASPTLKGVKVFAFNQSLLF